MRSANSHRRHIKFQDDGLGAEEQLTQVSKTEKIVSADDGSYFLSTERVRTVETKPAGREGPRFPNLHGMFTHKAMHQEDFQGVPVVTEEKEVIQETTKVSHGGGVDTRAEEFIRRKHQDLELQKLMSIKTT